MRLGNVAGKNRGKKYLKITGNEIITSENLAKANRFSQWFSENYEKLRHEFIKKLIDDEDQMNETYLRIYDKILYGGLVINDYKSYYYRAYFTNYIQNKIKQSEIGQMFVNENKDIDIIDDNTEDDENRRKHSLYNETIKFIKECCTSDMYNVFFAYLRIGERSYKPICFETGLPRDEVVKIINKVRIKVRGNKTLMQKRKSM